MDQQQEEILYEMKVEILKALANVTRLKIAEKLLAQELCVNDIVETLGQERTSVSKHISVLLKANLLSSRKEEQEAQEQQEQAPAVPSEPRIELGRTPHCCEQT